MSNLEDGSPFSLKNTVTGCYLGIEGNAGYAGAKAVAVDSLSGLIPRWSLLREQDAHYLINAQFPDMCLNVGHESRDVGASLQQWSCNGGRSELWEMNQTSYGPITLLNKNSGLAVGMASLASGHSITQVELASHAAQWEVSPSINQVSQHRDTKRTAQIATLAINKPCYAASLADETIYNIYAPIYSPHGTLSAVTQDLTRIASLGFSTLLIMPIHPIGVPTDNHPAVESPYAVSDYYSVAPKLGSLSDFAVLVSHAHSLGMKLIMDVVLNHTAWDHAFIKQRPHYYVHRDGNKGKSDSIAQAFWFEDVAQLDYKSGDDVRMYMTGMLIWWIKEYSVDGFRFDTADNPYGKDRMIPAATWLAIGQDLRMVHPGVILLGECTNPDLSLRPFNMDYNNYSLQPAIATAIKSQDARSLSKVFDRLKAEHPKGMLHTSIMQTWDMDLDLNMYGGPDGTMVAAVFNFTIEGIPMLFAGEEAANDHGGINTHAAINWQGPLAARFSTFYTQLGTLRRKNIALRRGETTWMKISGGGNGLVLYLRTFGTAQVLVAVNFSASVVQGVVQGLRQDVWVDVTPHGALRPSIHPSPASLKLGPWDFVVFARDSKR